MGQVDRNGNPVSTGSSQAAAKYNEGIDRAISNGAFVVETLETAIEADPGFALPRAALARQLQFQGRMKEARVTLAQAKELVAGTSPREEGHVAVIAACMESDGETALGLVKEHVADYPTDAWVLYQATGVYSLVGFSGHQDREQEQIDLLAPLASAYGDDWWYLAALAFAENELHMYTEARRHAERSLQLYEGSGATAHTVAHVHFETGDIATGSAFLAGWRPGLEREAAMYGHLAWHHALFELILGNLDRVDAIYANELSPAVSQEPALGRIADAASLLWRLLLGGRNGDLPWADLSAYAAERFAQPGVMFADVHCALAHAAAGNAEAFDRLVSGLRARADAGKLPAGSIVPDIAEAVGHFARGEYEQTARLLEPRIHEVVRIGGSRAQREVVEDTLIEAYFRAGEFERAEGLLRERVERRPNPRDDRWLARALAREAVPA
ncbi:MAG: tetratricopeptide repeat protein [Dehalococcoidia bacterium]|nr:tetratricopeptide repeat protein [Dehalococcoidia bacterium]